MRQAQAATLAPEPPRRLPAKEFLEVIDNAVHIRRRDEVRGPGEHGGELEARGRRHAERLRHIQFPRLPALQGLHRVSSSKGRGSMNHHDAPFAQSEETAHVLKPEAEDGLFTEDD